MNFNENIENEDFQLHFRQLQTWQMENASVLSMHEIATQEYIAGRSAVLQLGLFTAGFSLLAQSVEKLLKCYLLLNGRNLDDFKNKKRYKNGHDISALLADSAKLSNQPVLDNYAPLCGELFKWYQSRYPSAPNSANRWQVSDLPQIDELICHLEENMPLPPEFKHLIYGGGEMGGVWRSAFVRLFTATTSQHRAALLFQNHILEPRHDELYTKFLASRRYCAMPAETVHEFREKSEDISKKFAEMEQAR